MGKGTGISTDQRALGVRRESGSPCDLPMNVDDASGNWFRSYGNENWEFDESGLMRLRFASSTISPIGNRTQVSLATRAPSG